MRSPRTCAEIAAARIGGDVQDDLAVGPRQGRVISRFRYGVNLLLDGAGGRWMTVQHPCVGLHPWAIETPAGVPETAEGEAVQWDGTTLRFGGTHIRVATAVRVDLWVPVYDATAYGRAHERWQRLARVASAVTSAARQDPLHEGIGDILRAWHASGRGRLLCGLIGRGQGATPYGDDVLTGMLAGLWALSRVLPAATRQLVRLRSQTCCPAALVATTRPSAQTLRAAGAGRVCEALRTLLCGLSSADPAASGEAAYRRVAELGCSSGAGLLTGLGHILWTTPRWMTECR